MDSTRISGFYTFTVQSHQFDHGVASTPVGAGLLHQSVHGFYSNRCMASTAIGAALIQRILHSLVLTKSIIKKVDCALVLNPFTYLHEMFDIDFHLYTFWSI